MKRARLFSTDQKLFVECNKEERPEYHESMDKDCFLIRYDSWKKSCKTVEVHPSEVEKMEFTANLIWHTDKSDIRTHEEAFRQGILLPPYSVRIEKVYQGFEQFKEYAFLSEESSETQEEIKQMQMLIDFIPHYEIHRKTYSKWEDEDIAKTFVKNWNKSKFEIKRKQG